MNLLDLFYFASAILLAIYGFNSLFHTWLYWRMKRHSDGEIAGNVPEQQLITDADDGLGLPMVTVQLPIYNERHVAARLVAAVAQLDWPSDLLEIQVLDDSTDDTTQIVEKAIARVAPDVQIEHIHRTDRTGFKAGALQAGLATARGEFVAIFDADFIPPTNFLRRTIASFADDKVGCVQTRWGHINPATSQLTLAQSLGIDGHFVVEQYVRNKLGAFLNFNGTAGVWRLRCLENAGGWEHDTLTEDLDLSYRAQLAGWRIAYLPDLITPAELPVQIDAFKRQQFRWAKGSIQTAMKILPRLLRSQEPLWRKVLGTLHLTNYLVHPLMIANLLLLLPMILYQSPLLFWTPFLTSAAIGPPLMYWAAMRAQQKAGKNASGNKFRRLAVLMALGTGLSVNNTKAVAEAVWRIRSDFQRTPKFAVTEQAVTDHAAIEQTAPEQIALGKAASWHTSTYALSKNPVVWIEFGFAIYASLLLFYCLQNGIWWVVTWVLLYAAGYGYTAYLTFVQGWQLQRARVAALQAAAKTATLSSVSMEQSKI